MCARIKVSTRSLTIRDKRGKTQATIAAEAEEAARQEEELQAQRKLDSKELAGETIRRELAESTPPHRANLMSRGSRNRSPTRCGRYGWFGSRFRIR